MKNYRSCTGKVPTVKGATEPRAAEYYVPSLFFEKTGGTISACKTLDFQRKKSENIKKAKCVLKYLVQIK